VYIFSSQCIFTLKTVQIHRTYRFFGKGGVWYHSSVSKFIDLLSFFNDEYNNVDFNDNQMWVNMMVYYDDYVQMSNGALMMTLVTMIMTAMFLQSTTS